MTEVTSYQVLLENTESEVVVLNPAKLYNIFNSTLKTDKDGMMKKALETQARLADMHFKEASAIIAMGGRDNARKALLKFEKTKKLAPEYPEIEKTIAEATTQATVKVIVSFEFEDTNQFEYSVVIPLIEKQLAIVPYVEVIPSSTAKDPRNQGADLIVHIIPKLSYGSEVKINKKALGAAVSSAPNWQYEEMSMETSASYEIKYNVVDLKTNAIIDEGMFAKSDSTDYGFSVSAFLASGKTEDIKVGDMLFVKKMLVNTLAAGSTSMDLAYDLAYNKGIAQNKLPPINPVSMDSLNLNTYRSPAEFAKIKGFNNHIFYLFDFCKYTQVTDGKSQNLYSPTYKGAENGIRAALADRNLYTELKNWFTKRNHFELEAGFLKDLVKESVPSTHVKKVAPVLK